MEPAERDRLDLELPVRVACRPGALAELGVWARESGARVVVLVTDRGQTIRTRVVEIRVHRRTDTGQQGGTERTGVRRSRDAHGHACDATPRHRWFPLSKRAMTVTGD